MSILALLIITGLVFYLEGQGVPSLLFFVAAAGVWIYYDANPRR